MRKVYFIFGRNVAISCKDVVIADILEKELSLYPMGDPERIDLSVDYVDDVNVEGKLSSNPSINDLTHDGFIYHMGAVVSRFYISDGDVSKIVFGLKKSGRFIRIIRKWMNIQFTSHKEAIGQWIHEHILVPYAFINNDLSLVHASAVKTKSKKTLLFGGTGGVGKTSLEIFLCKHNEAAFVSDDICVVNEEGLVMPNLAYPKVYAYNIQGDKKTKDKIFLNRSILDKLQYKLHSLRGAKFARRRISPIEFYGEAVNQPEKIGGFFILFRCKTDSISFEKISKEKASKMNKLVISREYNIFFDHLIWSKYNSLGVGLNSSLEYDDLIQKNEDVLTKALSHVGKCWLVKIPFHIDHSQYQRDMFTGLSSMGYL